MVQHITVGNVLSPGHVQLNLFCVSNLVGTIYMWGGGYPYYQPSQSIINISEVTVIKSFL